MDDPPGAGLGRGVRRGLRRGLVTRDLAKSFGRRDVVSGIDIAVSEGEIVGLLGPNGAGKTTIFKMIIGLLRPTRGAVYLAGQDISSLPVHQRARLGLGYLAQGSSIFRDMSVRQNMLAALELSGCARGERGDRAAGLIRDMGLEPVADQRAGTLSGGERRRAEIGRALCVEPRVLILDEPFAAIDPRMAAELADQVAALKDRGLGLLLTDHGARQLLPLCDRVHVLVDGRVAAAGTVDEVVSDALVRKMYLGEGFTL